MKATLTVLGSGTSMGVPTIGCDCRVCTSDDPHDRRLRPSVLVEYDGHPVLIDTTPDFREQAIRENIKRLDAVLYTHAHADHILGLDDIRPLSFRREGKIPLYAHASAADSLEDIFRYIFKSDYKFGGIARVEMNRFNGPVELFGASFEPVEIIHGEEVI
ncbi:MAG: MBL fold metallo-hydrolase, partial [Candidatus Angelobacter sp.]